MIGPEEVAATEGPACLGGMGPESCLVLTKVLTISPYPGLTEGQGVPGLAVPDYCEWEPQAQG